MAPPVSGYATSTVPPGSARGLTNSFYALEYATIQDAINAAAAAGGGTIFIPEGTYNTTSTPTKYFVGTALPTNVPVHLVGAGPELTILQGPNNAGHLLQVRSSYQTVSGITFDGQGDNASTNHGILIGRSGTILREIVIENCVIRTTSGWGVYFQGEESLPVGSGAILCSIRQTEVRLNQNSGFGGIRIGKACTTILVENTIVDQFLGLGVEILEAQGVAMIGCTIEKEPNVADTGVFLHVNGSTQCLFSALRCEQKTAAQAYPFIAIDGAASGLTFDTCQFIRSQTTNPRVMSVNATVYGVVVINPRIFVDHPVTASDHFFVGGSATEFLLVGGKIIDSTGVASDPAISTSLPLMGLPPEVRLVSAIAAPRMPALTTAQRNALPYITAGIMVFNIDVGVKKAQVFDGTAWQNLW
ncbi:MAG TPA: right-handed parallel beta-helix repeat-containing protein [Candidatus Saccharimonadaceae bacterium]|jgi:hypothetical protein|nr:right-handed parallel beta-helix repeat-containing protein [Candidatus Saccharimonadaceae bacterium]